MPKMELIARDSIIKRFEFTKDEVVQIEDFINNHMNITAGEILDSIIGDNKLNDKQKIVISYIIGNSVGHAVSINSGHTIGGKGFGGKGFDLPDIGG